MRPLPGLSEMTCNTVLNRFQPSAFWGSQSKQQTENGKITRTFHHSGKNICVNNGAPASRTNSVQILNSASATLSMKTVRSPISSALKSTKRPRFRKVSLSIGSRRKPSRSSLLRRQVKPISPRSFSRHGTKSLQTGSQRPATSKWLHLILNGLMSAAGRRKAKNNPAPP